MRRLLLLPLLLMIGCANQKAGILVADAHREFQSYRANADTKVQNAEDARLALELRLVRMDLVTLFKNDAVPAEDAATATIAEVMKKVHEYQARLNEWHLSDNSAAIISLELGAVTKYHETGVKAEDLIPSIDALGEAAPLFFPIKPVKVETDFNVN